MPTSTAASMIAKVVVVPIANSSMKRNQITSRASRMAPRSTNGGGRWYDASAGLLDLNILSLAIDPVSPSTLYAGTLAWNGTRLYKSTNGGAYWAISATGLSSVEHRALVVDPATPGRVYVGTDLGVYRSTDAGASWAAANVGLTALDVTELALDPARPTTIYAGTHSGGVFVSTDAGDHWAPARRGFSPRVQALTMEPAGTTLLAAFYGAGVWQIGPPTRKGDMNGDGLPDLLFRSNLAGTRNKVWLMNGVQRVSEADIAPDAASRDWVLRGVDDFDVDGHSDLAFWSQATGAVELWLMNGATRVGAPAALTGGAALPTNWNLAATADFDRDGRPDVVWRNVTSQKLVIWTLSGTAKAGAIVPTPSQAVDANWLIVAAADYNGDGATDLLWYNHTSGKIVTWYMDAAVVRISGQFTSPPNAGDHNWQVVASADYSGPSGPGAPPVGSPDVLWRNTDSGNQVVWHMDFASARVFGEFTVPVANSPALDWTVVGPR